VAEVIFELCVRKAEGNHGGCRTRARSVVSLRVFDRRCAYRARTRGLTIGPFSGPGVVRGPRSSRVGPVHSPLNGGPSSVRSSEGWLSPLGRFRLLVALTS
jgi:hypothetical protein